MTTRFSGKWHASPSFRASIILPFIVISVALGVLAWRSYQLSVRMENGLHALSIQYLDYAAEITARRVDALARTEMFNASDDWQQTERTPNGADFPALRGWVSRHPWIATAIYIPDGDPEGALYVSERKKRENAQEPLPKNEFYTASGTVRYSYDPQQLLAFARSTLRTDALLKSAHTDETLRKQSEIQFIPTPKQTGLIQTEGGLSVIAPLSEPLEHYSVIASVRTSYIASGWANHRVISLWLAAISVLLVAFGAAFAIRGLEREAEAMQLRAALIANVSHELRTPLSMIRLAAETLKRSTKLTPAEQNDLQQSILREVLHLSHLVENVLDIARLQKSDSPPVLRATPPPELVRSVVASYEPWISSKGFTITLDIDSKVPEQMWDREALSRALINLIDNAMKYSGSENWLRVSLAERDEHVAISVQDRGIGIPEADLQRIFEPYYRSGFSDTETRRGAGLGLTLVNQIVQRHGGKIEVESAVGLGSTFTMLLPKQPKAAEAVGIDAFEASKA